MRLFKVDVDRVSYLTHFTPHPLKDSSPFADILMHSLARVMLWYASPKVTALSLWGLYLG